MGKLFHETLQETLTKLRLTQTEAARRLGLVHRTVNRWALGDSAPNAARFTALVRMIHALDPASAEELAASAGWTLAAAGIATTKAGALSREARLAIDSVLCSAFDAFDGTPKTLRPALAAALARMRELGLSIDDAERALKND